MDESPTWLRRHWRPLTLALLLVLLTLLVAYAVAAIFVLPQWIVHRTAGKADGNSQLAAVTATRSALLGILTPVVVVVGGIAAFLNYWETVRQNVRAAGLAREDRDEARRLRHADDELAHQDRDEARRLRRADVYAEFFAACEELMEVTSILYFTHRDQTDLKLIQEYTQYILLAREKSRATELAIERVRLLGSDSVGLAAADLRIHLATMYSKVLADKKPSARAWTRLRSAEYLGYWSTALAAAREDLRPTR